MNLLRIQLRGDRAGLLGWGGGLFVFTLAVAASYSAIAEDAEAFDQLFENFAGIEDAFGVDSFTSPDGYLKGQAVALFPLLLGVYGGLAATKALAGAQETGRLDHVLARPVPRVIYLATVAGALALGQLLILLLAGLGAVIGYAAADQPSDILGGAFLMALEVVPIALAHLALALLAGTLVDRKGPATAIVIGVVVGGFAIDLVGKLVDRLDWLEYVTPYGWWGRSDWFNGSIDGLYLVASLLLVVLATAGAFLRFDSKDL